VAVRPRGLSPSTAAGIAVALLLAASGVAGGLLAHRSARDASVAGWRHAATADVRRFQAALDTAVLASRSLADVAATGDVAAFRDVAGDLVATTPLVVAALAPVGSDGVPAVAMAAPVPVPPLRRDQPVAAAGTVEAAVSRSHPVIGRADGGELLVVAPVSTAPGGAPISDRRAATTAVVVGLLDVEAMTRSILPSAAVRISGPGGVLHERGDARGHLLTASVEAGGAVWEVELDPPPRRPGAAPWTIALAGVALGVVGGVLVGRALRHRSQAERTAEDRTRQLERIAETGARVQQTLDLGALLPAFAIGLADEFELRHVAISLVDGDGRDVEVFTMGDRAAGLDPHPIPLQRGWRRVGTLSVRPRSPLAEAEQTSLLALGDLLAVALTNARLLQREQEATARLRDLDALKNAFLGTVSHELRTSMTAIMGFGELLVEAWDEMPDARRRELAERVRRAAGSLRHLVDDLLDFARLEQHRLQVSPRSIDLGEAVGRTVEALRSLLVDHGLDLRLGEGVTAWVDPLAVERIVANLLSNAAKYSPAGSTVTVAVEPAGDRARLVVDDEGPGIPASERAKVFVRFYRLETDATVRTRGAGIGLSILRDFAERSGAEVRIGESPAGGARFTVDFLGAPPAAVEPSLAEQAS
jgi:signal transduction histidine kinase